MRCNDVQELFGVYFDLPEDDLRRQCVDEHISRCAACREEFEIWKESTDLIRLAAVDEPLAPPVVMPITNQVMSRIYKDESWRLPIADRIYNIPYKLRRNLTAVIAFCLALFMFSFLYTIVSDNTKEVATAEQGTQYGFKQAVRASSDTPGDALNVHNMSRPTLASVGPTIIEPIKIGPIRTMPDYLLALSILGLISTLLIMNWLSRTRA